MQSRLRQSCALLGLVGVFEGVAGAWTTCPAPYDGAVDCSTSAGAVCTVSGTDVDCNTDRGGGGGTQGTILRAEVVGTAPNDNLIVYGVNANGYTYCCDHGDFLFAGYPASLTITGADNATRSDTIDLEALQKVGAVVDTYGGDDEITGTCVTGYYTAVGDHIDAGAGDDYVQGCNGNDVLYGGTGNDTVHGNEGTDTVYAGDGFGNGGTYNLLTGGPGTDTIYGSNDSAGGDDIYGDLGGFTCGATDHDHLYGMGGNDKLCGECGNDYLYGGEGNDSLYGGASDDDQAMDGGDGTDHCENDAPRTSCSAGVYLTSCPI